MKNEKGKFFQFLRFGFDLKRFFLLMGYTFGVIALVVCLNYMFRFCTEKFDAKLDLSRDRIFTLSPQAKDYLRNCDRKLKFVVEGSSDAYGIDSIMSDLQQEIIKSAVASNKNFDIDYKPEMTKEEFEERFKKIKFLNNIPQTKRPEVKCLCYVIDETDANDLKGIYLNLLSLVSVGDFVSYEEYLKLKQSNFEEKNDKKYIEIALAVERDVVSSIAQLTGKNLINVGLVSGHKELNYSLDSAFFDNLGLKFEEVKLQSVDIPQNIDVLFIVAPMVDFSKEEISKLEDYLNKGGKIFYCASAQQSGEMELLNGFLKKLGFVFSDGCVISPENFAKNGALTSVDLTKFNNVVTNRISERVYPLVLDECKPMSLQNAQDGWQVSEICKTTPNYAKVANESDNIANAAKSEFVIAGMSQKDVEKGRTAKVFAMSSCMFNKGLFSFNVNVKNNDNFGRNQNSSRFEGLLSGVRLGNANFIGSAFKELSGKEGLPYLSPKSFMISKGTDVNLKMLKLKEEELKATYKFYHILIGVVVPLILFMSAVAVWLIKKFLLKKA